jgi:hypothetical protein
MRRRQPKVMKEHSIFPPGVVFTGILIVSLAASAPAAESCAVAVKDRVEILAEIVTLADVLGPSTCPALLREASRMKLGRAPLAGSDRVLDPETLRALLAKAAAAAGITLGSIRELYLPERTTLRRAAALTPAPNGARPHSRAAAIGSSTVRPGELVHLLWDQNGIRSIVPATCLDQGTTGDQVRARIQPSGQVVKATVISAGLVQVVL